MKWFSLISNQAGRRLLLLLLFVFLIIFGANIEGPSPTEVYQRELQIAFKDVTYRLPDKINARSGDRFRLSYWVRALGNNDIDAREVEGSLNDTSTPGPTVIKTYAIGPDKKELIDSVEVPVGTEFIYSEKVFEAKFEVTELIMERETNVGLTGINLQGVVLTRLNATASQLSALQKTVSSKATFNVPSVTQLTGDERLYSFIGRSDALIQTFSPTNPYIAGVDVRLRFNRTGGQGSYQAKLVKITSQENTKLDFTQVAEVNFDVQNPRITDENGTTYRLPLFARVVTGEKYGLIITGEQLRTNILHHLTVLGTSEDKYSDGAAYILKKNNKITGAIGDLHFQIWGATFTENSFGRYLNGQVIEDKGEDMLLTYIPVDDYSSLLDLEGIVRPEGYDGPGVYYDRNSRQIVGAAYEGVSYMYKLVSPNPITSFFLSAGLVNPTGGQTIVSYSTDGTHWMEMVADARGTIINRSYETGTTNVIYLRISYQGEQVKDGSFGLFDPIIQARIKK